jgi:hypothetical protein
MVTFAPFVELGTYVAYSREQVESPLLHDCRGNHACGGSDSANFLDRSDDRKVTGVVMKIRMHPPVFIPRVRWNDKG